MQKVSLPICMVFPYFFLLLRGFFCHSSSVLSFILSVPPKCHQREKSASPWDSRLLATSEEAKAKFLLPNIRIFATKAFPDTAKM